MNPFILMAQSFYSADAYRKLRQSSGVFFGYALLVVMLCTFLTSLHIGTVFHRELFAARGDNAPSLFEDVVQQIAAQTPVMMIRDGVLATRDEGPVTITLRGTAFGESFENFPLAVIDTSGQTTHENMAAPILINAQDIIIKTDNKTELKSIREITKDGPSTIIINRAMAEDISKQLIVWMQNNLWIIYLILGGLFWLFFTFGIYVARLCMLLFLGLVGLAIGAATRQKITYETSLRFAAVSYTPVALLHALSSAVFDYSPHTLVLIVAGSVALYAALYASEKPASTPSGNAPLA